MPPIPSTYSNPTGKRNTLASFKKWLELNVPAGASGDFAYAFLSDVSNAETFAKVGVSELQYFQPGNTAFGMNVFPASTYPVGSPAKNGTLQNMLLQIEIKADATQQTDALRLAYKIRDRIRKGLILAGVADDETLALYVDPIVVNDYENGGAATGIIARVPFEQDNAVQEVYIPPDESAPNIHTLRLLVRLEWFELN